MGLFGIRTAPGEHRRPVLTGRITILTTAHPAYTATPPLPPIPGDGWYKTQGYGLIEWGRLDDRLLFTGSYSRELGTSERL